MPPRLTIVIVTWNVADYLRKCLQSLMIHGATEDAVVEVVDNASTDGTGDMVRAEFPWVRLTCLDRNIGFSRANNLVLARCGTPYVWLLNPDTEIHPGAVRRLIATMEELEDIGAVGPRQLGRSGDCQRDAAAAWPTTWNVWCDLVRLSHLFPRSRLFARRSLGWLDPEGDHDVPGVAGSALLLRTSLLSEIGLLDETMFCVEDMDLCRRVVEHGYRVRYVGTASITHYGGESVKRSEAKALHRQISFQSFWLYMVKHDGHLRAASMTAAVGLTALLGLGAVSAARLVVRRQARFAEQLAVPSAVSRALLEWALMPKRKFVHDLAAPPAEAVRKRKSSQASDR